VWLQRGESSTVSDGFEIALSRGKAPSRRSPLPEEPDAAVVLRLLRQPPPPAAEASTASGTAPLALTADDEGLTEAFGKARPYRMLDGRTVYLNTLIRPEESEPAAAASSSSAAAAEQSSGGASCSGGGAGCIGGGAGCSGSGASPP
jgi:Predicted membrane protein